MSERCLSPRGSKWMIGIGCCLLLFSLIILLIFPRLYSNILKKDLTLTEGSLATKVWEDIPLPLYERLYFFNITNGDEFLHHNASLNVTQVGPYTYQGRWVKTDPIWNPNGTVSYRETRTYQFIPEKSVGSQDNVINTLNGPFIIAAKILEDYNILARIGFAFIMGLRNQHIVIEKRIRELVYEGYKDPIIKYAPLLKPNIPFKNGIFSWLYGKNATDDGLFNVYTGAEDASLTNMIAAWNGNSKMNFWKEDKCNEIKGTSVETGPPLPDVPDNYTFFQSIFCRSLTFNYTGDETHHGVLTKRFKPTPMVFANSTENPENSCYEVDRERPSGVLDVSPCQFDAPVLLSFPHFHMADSSYLENVNGLRPDSNDHDSHLDAEPITGLTLDISIKFQMNLVIERVRGIPQLNNIREGTFPVFWADIQIQLDQNWADYLKGQLNNPKIIVYSVFGSLLLIALVLIIIGIVFLEIHRRNYKDDLLIEDKNIHEKNSKPPRKEMPNYGGVSREIEDEEKCHDYQTTGQGSVQYSPLSSDKS